MSESGVHLHHLFFGIALTMAAGARSFAAGETDGPWSPTLSAAVAPTPKRPP